MRQSKPQETAREATETHGSEGLVRHYRKIGAPAVAAALNVGKQNFSKETADQALRKGDVVAPPAFLDHHAA